MICSISSVGGSRRNRPQPSAIAHSPNPACSTTFASRPISSRDPHPPASNRRVGIAERALRLAFPEAQTPFVPGFQYGYWRPLPLGTASPRPALSRLRVKTPKRVIVSLSADEVAHFWASFRTSRDLAIVGLMLLDGLRSC